MEDKLNAILQGLNEEQEQAVQCVEGPVLIVAGAGSGKTRVLTSRVAYILAKGEEPSSVLALTFTKKAAGEMKERIGAIVGPRAARKVVMGTFHAIFVRFLREYAPSLGYPDNFTIYDTSDSVSAIKACIKELALDDSVYKPKDVLGRISRAKNNLITESGYKGNPEIQNADLRGRKPRIGDIYALYQAKMKQAGVMDFDDILLNTNKLFRDNPAALEAIAGRFKYIMVDEYQDTNAAQYLILKRLAQFHRNICVVGDDSQSIYAFRGAKIENILSFRKDYPECRVFRLERNYRSTATIVDAANSLIAKNSNRIPKKCYSMADKGEKITLLSSYTEGDESLKIVCDILDRMRADKASYQDFAILYRTNSQSRSIEEQLRRRNLPYMIYSGNSFYERAEVKDMMAYFKLAVNPNDDESFKRVVNKPARAIGDTSVSALNECARAHGCCLFKAAFQQDTEVYGLKPAALQKIRAFCAMVEKWAVQVATTDAYELASAIASESGLYASFKADNSIEGLARAGNVEELLNSVKAFVEDRMDEAEDEIEEGTVFTLDDFLENTALLSNADTSEGDDTNNKIALMTVHSAKGLEFPYVYIAGMEDNLFPSMNMMASSQDLEEERRLFYVALTRAKRAVKLSFASTRMRNGKHESNPVSRFVKEIDPQYIANAWELDSSSDVDDSPAASYAPWGRFRNYAYGKSSRVTVERRQPMPSMRKPDIIDPDFKAVPMTELYEGERVEHNRFGAGLIKSISGTFPEMKAVVVFDGYGEKMLLLKHAKLRPERR